MAVSLLVFMMQKYTIFTKYHSVCLTNQINNTLDTENKRIISCNPSNYRGVNFKEILAESPNKQSVIVEVLEMDLSKVLMECIKHYHFVQAAGGLVRNTENEILFIFRNGKWDLPKGHKEVYETIDQTAVREVEEECGIHDLILENKAGVTYHTYYMNGKHELKETHWYFMRTNTQRLVPQKEEGIEKAEWISKDRMQEIISGCYLSLQNLLLNIKL